MYRPTDLYTLKLILTETHADIFRYDRLEEQPPIRCRA